MNPNFQIADHARASAEILTTAEMYAADAAAIAQGTTGDVLMENAGKATADQIVRRWPKQPATILCGPGNNGGDGFVIARHLSEKGWPVQLALFGEPNALTGDAAKMASLWIGEPEDFDTSILPKKGIVVDALFGAGLTRDIEGKPAEIIEEINRRNLTCVAVDIPSGVSGDTGEVHGLAPQCDLTVTFFRRKPGHLLFPGRSHCGHIVTVDIGIPDDVLHTIAPATLVNRPALWDRYIPQPTLGGHKYSRGYALIVGGVKMTGAARLSARAAARIGAGMVGIAAPEEAVSIYASDDPSFLIHRFTKADQFASLLEDNRISGVLVGPGAGVNTDTAELTLLALKSRKPTVLDADALTVFADRQSVLFRQTKNSPVVMTPHEAEFARLFDFQGDKLSRCRAAAAKSGAVVLLKGPDTVVAAPDGRAVVNENGPAILATAGSGDVLSGLITGLLSQNMEPFLAAAASCWIHGAAANKFGRGLIASDLPEMIPPVLRDLFATSTIDENS
ncbi:MAG: bifunctional ADP-dependent NAD(P)H-hydrate dehydratase/NAD(P)H-hydrate epimerase [Rhodospirillaceae bacterium]|nr:bifunctional ADP-dependent NAD(P)H-hydrate dehydratase/NAD(P)H-hydrate epimerase [Rhodospirillaceae bacterium]